MKVKHYNVDLTKDDFDTLGMGLEMYLTEEAKTWKKHKIAEDMCEYQLDLLQSFIYLGYRPATNATEKLDCKNYDDAREWFKTTYKICHLKK